MHAEFDPNMEGACIIKSSKSRRQDSTSKETKRSKSKSSSKSERLKSDSDHKKSKSGGKSERRKSEKERLTDSPSKRKQRDALYPSERDRSRSTRRSSVNEPDRSRSLSVARRRRDKVLDFGGSSLLDSPSKNRNQQALVTPSRRRPTTNIKLMTPRKKESRGSKLRESWKEITKEKENESDNMKDDFLDKKAEDSKRALLDKSRHGPIRASSRQRGMEQDNDDDLLSIGSSSLASNCSKSFHDESFGAIAGSYIKPNSSSSYLPNQLNHGGHQRRRNSRFGSSFDRMQALQDFKDDPLGIKYDGEEDEPQNMYGYEIPGDMDRSIRSISRSRRPSAVSNTPIITVPDISGTSYENDGNNKKGHRRILSSLSMTRNSSQHKDEKRQSSTKSPTKVASSKPNGSTTVHKDRSTVDEIIKNRRLRRGSAGHLPSSRDLDPESTRDRRRSSHDAHPLRSHSRRGSQNGSSQTINRRGSP